MRGSRELRLLALVVLVTPLAARGAPVVLQVAAGTTTVVQGGATGAAGPDAASELDPALADKDAVGLTSSATGAAAAARPIAVNRSIARAHSRGDSWMDGGRDRDNPELQLSFHGLDHFATRTANGGNQFSNEPPDQGLCAGHGFVLETVNTVLRVFDTRGHPLTGVQDLNTFYGYPAAIARTATPRTFGPEVFDPSCYYDPQVQRWFHLASTLERASPTTTALSGQSHIDLAVSTTSNPLGSWIVYRIPAENDGTNGTPDHHCALNDAGDPGPCFPDYPHIGADDNGIYITTNEFDFFGPGFHGALIYAISKRALARGASRIDVNLLDTADPGFGIAFDGVVGFPGFTVWPAQSATGGGDGDTEYFLSSQAVFNDSGTDHRLRLWSVSNTDTLDSRRPRVTLSASTVNVIPYGVPPPADQKAGPTPLLECLNDTALPVAPGVFGCWNLTGAAGGPFQEVEGPLNTNDSRVQQVSFSNGRLLAALDTAATVNGASLAGIGWFVINPRSSRAVNQGVLALDGVNLTYPALAVTRGGRGVMTFTAVGPGLFPSAAYAGISAGAGVGHVHIAAAGQGPQDGFTEYTAFPPFRPRWGDYGAAAPDGDSVWLASEYIGQSCSYADFVQSNFTCGSTRTILGNWGTRISKVTP